ncbi:MAG: hypothetical protein ACI88A_001999 [Paraglaciecola sp.]|jgi:hypothetical protein
MKLGMQAVMTAQAGKGKELAAIMLEASAPVADMQGLKFILYSNLLLMKQKF